MSNNVIIEHSPAPAPAPSTERRASYNPATGALLGYVPLVGSEGIDAAIQAARTAQPAWGATPARERAAVLQTLQGIIVDEAEAITTLISLEQGKTTGEAYG